MLNNSKKNKIKTPNPDIEIELNKLKSYKSVLEEKLKLTELKIEGFELMLKKET
jgi:hypothetical protein